MTKHNEKWLLERDWERTEGWKVDNATIYDEEGFTFFEKLEDCATTCVFYTDPNDETWCSDILADCIERQEEYDEDYLEDEDEDEDDVDEED